MILQVDLQGCADLSEVGRANDLPGHLLGLTQGRQQDGQEHNDDCNHNQQLNQGKTPRAAEETGVVAVAISWSVWHVLHQQRSSLRLGSALRKERHVDVLFHGASNFSRRILSSFGRNSARPSVLLVVT